MKTKTNPLSPQQRHQQILDNMAKIKTDEFENQYYAGNVVKGFVIGAKVTQLVGDDAKPIGYIDIKNSADPKKRIRVQFASFVTDETTSDDRADTERVNERDMFACAIGAASPDCDPYAVVDGEVTLNTYELSEWQGFIANLIGCAMTATVLSVTDIISGSKAGNETSNIKFEVHFDADGQLIRDPASPAKPVEAATEEEEEEVLAF